MFLNFLLFTMNSTMIRPTMWLKGWLKHAAVCCVYKLISI